MRRLAIAVSVGAALCAGAHAQAQSAAPPAAAGQPGGQNALFSSNGPIDVSSDAQERAGADHLIFRGNVEVIQGQARLRSPQIDLFYAPRGQGAGDHAATSGGSLGAIQRAEALGPVYYITPTQSAKGDHGQYLAADDRITMTGNVVLTQGQNVSTGDKLVIHQKTSQAVLSSEKAAGRVRGVFYNEDKNKPAAGSPPAPAPAR